MTSPRRAGRTARPTGDERQLAIVETFEALLQARPMADIAVDDIASGAAISRSAFYFYFSSKQAVLLHLLDRMVDEVDTRLAALGVPEEDPGSWWRRAIGVFVEVFGAHRAVTVTMAEARATSPELREKWSRHSGRWVAMTTSAIAAEVHRGRTRPLRDPEALAVVLTTMNEAVLVASLRGDQPALDPGETLDVLVDVWCASIYGTQGSTWPRPAEEA